MRGSRTQAERDAITVEMVFAMVSGAVLAAVGFLAVVSPVMADEAHGTAREGWFTAAVIVAAAAFCGRVALTLRRFEQRGHALHERIPLPGAPVGADAGAERGAGAESGTGTGPDTGAQWGTAAGRSPSGGGSVTSGQPSQPGRTSPDS
ncbi:DUF6332 family protein [Streptomyces sp. NPDC088910]|uniref:DUF6332 family protein n=1 Tax=Streptomyces sp. NPDC088910 TaxID=3365911 RepID=UPI0038120379